MTTRKPRDASAHHGALRRMRLHYDGCWTLDATGADFHRYEYRGFVGHRWAATAPAKIAAHLSAEGYEETRVSESVDNQGFVHHRTRDHRRGDELVRVLISVDRAGRERIVDLRHFPHGTGQTPRFTPAEMARAATFGPLGMVG